MSGLLPALCVLVASATAQSAFRTIVVFGDTQHLVDGRDPALYEGFGRMVSWVIEHREDQHVDFVLHVGDAIETGFALPLPAKCAGSNGRCDPSRTALAAGKERPCYCGALKQVREEWARFNRQWRRLDGILPYAIVQGNHDNLGTTDSSAPLNAPGFAQFYGPEYFRAIESSGWISSHADEQGLSQAWRFQLGARPVLVIGAAQRFTEAGKRWAERVLEEHPGMPAIAIAHHFFVGVPGTQLHPRLAWTGLVGAYPERFALAVWGHWALGEVRFTRVRKLRVLRLRSDWQRVPGRQTYLNLVRLHDEADGSHSIEILAFDPVRGSTDFEAGLDRERMTRGHTWLPRRPFGLDPEERR